MKTYQVRFAEEALADLARNFAGLLPIAGEPLARDFVGRLENACLKLVTFPGRGSLRAGKRSGLRIIGYPQLPLIGAGLVRSKNGRYRDHEGRSSTVPPLQPSVARTGGLQCQATTGKTDATHARSPKEAKPTRQ